MKKIILSSLVLALVMLSCNQKNKDEKAAEEKVVVKTETQFSCPMHPEITGKEGDVCSECGMELEAVKKGAESEDTKVDIAEVSPEVKASVSTDAIINAYLKIKNALANDNEKEATAAAKEFEKAVTETKTANIDSKLLTKYLNSTDSAKKQAALIVKNDGKMDQQRMYFAVLSKDISTLISTFGSSQHLYQDYCPMYNEGKSGYWISEFKGIKNPYYGSEMLECGGMIKEIK
ncbi:DUF3347 domain-containing protein [Flavobacterium flavipallidum]|uniref:DUF3347 domain-containing protein n=1 Tax=Flavobacterium flavipallidum TaxID=3139140 RepID=A0ABU9HI98_9FLAO